MANCGFGEVITSSCCMDIFFDNKGRVGGFPYVCTDSMTPTVPSCLASSSGDLNSILPHLFGMFRSHHEHRLDDFPFLRLVDGAMQVCKREECEQLVKWELV